jgi:1-acyl-sn-glycerol-3-phosphate acyltransferase
MIVLRSLLFNIIFFSLTVLMCFLLIWTIPLPRKQMLGVVHLWLRQVAWVERTIGGMSYRVVGWENVPDGPCLIAAKHQSAWETLKLHLLFRDPAVVLKKELLSIPIWGWYLSRIGMIPIDRSAGSQAVQVMIQAARRAILDKRKIVIFPQGTRVAPGDKRPYKSGIAALYRELDLPIIPMALNSGLLWAKNSFVRKPGVITIEFLPPIPRGLTRQEMMGLLQSELESASDRLAGIRLASLHNAG